MVRGDSSAIDGSTVHDSGEGELERGGDVFVVDDAELLRGVPAHAGDLPGERFEVSVAVAVDEREPQDGPVQSARAQLLLGLDLAGRVGERGVHVVVLTAGVGRVGVVDVGGAGQEEAGVGCVVLCGADEVAGAVQVDPPDLVLVGGAEQGGEVDDRRHVLNGCRE